MITVQFLPIITTQPEREQATHSSISPLVPCAGWRCAPGLETTTFLEYLFILP